MATYKNIPVSLRTMLNNPGTAFVACYFAAANLGALLLCLPIATRSGRIPWIDAIFTATSALSVTGLTVVDTESTYTLFGQIVILLLIQFGGLGIMTFAVWIFAATGWRVSVLQRCFIQDTYASDPTVDMKRLLYFIISFVLTVELLGAVLLMISLWGELSPGRNCYFALFHSISAFCNAGFALFPDNFVVYQGNVLLNLTIAFLIIFGGIGFPVFFELLSWARKPTRTRLSLHTRIVLQTTLILIVGGMILIWLFERNTALAAMSIPKQFLASFFQSVTCRTAGFNTVRFDLLNNATLMICIVLMFIGASPGSCGGGVKTTSAATLVIVLWNRLCGRDTNRVHRSSITASAVSKTISVVIVSALFIVSILCCLLMTDIGHAAREQSRGIFLEYLFETVSAFGTVGLSMGLTPRLDTAGKALITLTMFTGRVGILTLVYLFAQQKAPPRYEYAEENIMIG
jgi:trk system potassium uptake protein